MPYKDKDRDEADREEPLELDLTKFVKEIK